MSQENVEVMRQVFAAWEANDFDGSLHPWMRSWLSADTLRCRTLGLGTDARALWMSLRTGSKVSTISR